MEKLKIKVSALQEVQMKKYFMMSDFGKVRECRLYHFSDAC